MDSVRKMAPLCTASDSRCMQSLACASSAALFRSREKNPNTHIISRPNFQPMLMRSRRKERTQDVCTLRPFAQSAQDEQPDRSKLEWLSTIGSMVAHLQSTAVHRHANVGRRRWQAARRVHESNIVCVEKHGNCDAEASARTSQLNRATEWGGGGGLE